MEDVGSEVAKAVMRLLATSSDGRILRSQLDLALAELAVPATGYRQVLNLLRANGVEVAEDPEDDDDRGWDAEGFGEFVRRSRHEVLTFAEEQALGVRIDQGRLAEAQLEEQTDAERQRWLHRLVADGEAAKEELASHNIRLVVNLAAKAAWRGSAAMELEDIVQEGYFGLARAIEKWDYQRGLKFSTYATWWIRQQIGRAIQDRADAIRMPVHAHETLSTINKARREIVNQGRRPTVSAIAAAAGLRPKLVRELLAVQTRPASLDRRVGDGTTSIGDLIPDTTSEAPDEIIVWLLLNEAINEALGELSDREREVMALRYGLEDGRGRTLEEIGREFGVTRERIRQIESKCLAKLRHPHRCKKLRDYLDGA
jgi:RNA polymerase primary sigma factor